MLIQSLETLVQQCNQLVPDAWQQRSFAVSPYMVDVVIARERDPGGSDFQVEVLCRTAVPVRDSHNAAGSPRGKWW